MNMDATKQGIKSGTGSEARRPARGGSFRGANRGGGASDNRRAAGAGGGDRRGNRYGGPRRGGRSRSDAKGKPEFDQKVIDVRRVARVVQGGRRFSFSVVVVIGDRNGAVGLGSGKASDTALAIEKATRDAKKHMIKIPRTKTKSLPHEVRGVMCASEVLIIPAKGKGVVAGSSVRAVLGLAGITNVTAKVLSRSKNKLNNASAAMNALAQLRALPPARH